MKVFSVLQPPEDGEGSEARAVRTMFIKDGMAWWALFFPILWMLFHRLWLALLCYLIYAAVLVGLGQVLNENAVTIIGILGAILFAMEANHIRRWTMQRRGWSYSSDVIAHDRLDAEYRYFAGLERRQAAEAVRHQTVVEGQSGRVPTSGQSTAAHRTRARVNVDGPVMGLFPEAER